MTATATGRFDAEAMKVTRIVAEVIGRDPAGNWADAIDQALTDAGIDLDGVEEPDGSDDWEIVRYRAADGAICRVYLADESQAGAAAYRVIEEA